MTYKYRIKTLQIFSIIRNKCNDQTCIQDTLSSCALGLAFRPSARASKGMLLIAYNDQTKLAFLSVVYKMAHTISTQEAHPV